MSRLPITLHVATEYGDGPNTGKRGALTEPFASSAYTNKETVPGSDM